MQDSPDLRWARLTLGLALVAVGCGSSQIHDTVDVNLASATLERPVEGRPAPPIVAIDAAPRAVAAPQPDLGSDLDSSSTTEQTGESICDIDPGLCALRDPKLVASCGCDQVVDRARTKCLIDCAARERQGIDAKLRSGRY